MPAVIIHEPEPHPARLIRLQPDGSLWVPRDPRGSKFIVGKGGWIPDVSHLRAHLTRLDGEEVLRVSMPDDDDQVIVPPPEIWVRVDPEEAERHGWW